MKRTVATVGLVCALMIGCMGMPPVRAAESDTDKVTTDIGTKVMPFEELSVEVVDSMSIPSMTRATSRIEWNISPDTVMKADTAYSLEADEIVTINCTYSPRTANLDFGFITQDDTFHFTSGSNGSIKTNIQIDKTGKYYFAVRNNENETVEVLGYAGHPNAIFSEDAMKAVHSFSSGIPRLINRACTQSLVYAYQNRRAIIDDRMVQLVLEGEVS